MFFKHLRQVRDTKKGEELKKVGSCTASSLAPSFHHTHTHHIIQELQLLRGWVDDDPKLFTADVILSLLLSYRDIQVGGASGWG